MNIRKPKFRILYHPVPSPRTWETDHDYLDAPSGTQPVDENHKNLQDAGTQPVQEIDQTIPCDQPSSTYKGNNPGTIGQSTKNALEGVKKILESTDFQHLKVFGPEMQPKTNKRKEIENENYPLEKVIK